jgi:hypothetical protein
MPRTGKSFRKLQWQEGIVVAGLMVVEIEKCMMIQQGNPS